MFRYRLFGMVPVSRRTTVETMADPVVSVDADGTVVDSNPAAQRLFGVDRRPVGTHLSEFARDHPEIISLYEPNMERTEEVSLDADGRTRHFSFHLRPIEQGGSATGSLIVLREVTRLRERERELDLLKQVFSRVFRHNIRNELTVLNGEARAIAELDESGTFAEPTGRILVSTNQLLAHAEKAISFRRVIDAEPTAVRTDLGAVAAEQVRAVRTDYPDLSIETDLPDDVHVDCHPAVGKAVRELLDNAVRHHPGDVRVSVTVRRDGATGTLVVADDGPGIDPHEVATLEANEESDLQHGSGVGLWLVDLIARKCDGTFTIDADSPLGGTRAKLSFPLAAPDDGETDAGAVS
ncbi:sensor histidine kinase [Halostella litorea]|uniref:sensor histidine kinase n=1 Tax=Halostella litorea TaxID=2528831 RepID=UPI001092DB9F|nr:PAS domain-containing sensor histidine kinase [Halostella litorea]